MRAKTSDKRLFRIGDFVTTRYLVEMRYAEEDGASQGRKRRAVRVDQAREIRGQIVGACIRHEGIYYAGRGAYGHHGEWEDDPACLQIERVVTLWEIREGYLNKSLLAFADDIKHASGGDIPWRHCIQTPCDARVRAELSKAAKAQKRNAKGRFVKD